MATYKRLPRGKQKPHDEFKDWTINVLIWIKENWRTSIELLAVAAVALAVMVGANTYWTHRSEKAAEMLYSASLLKAGSDEQMKALGEVAEGYSRAPAGQQAMMQLGGIYLDSKNYDKAMGEFRMLAARSRSKAVLNVAAQHMIAATELAKGDWTAAAESYLKAAADPHNLIALESRYRAAACLERSGDAARAVQLYRQVIADAKEEDRAVRDLSEERLIWLIASHKVQG
ncbi:MAG: hypothetical protein V2A66_08580 [Pseudomonadota bacterium]